jgi:2-deoxy-D-gluconate 3-dehydrogenase
MSKGKVERLFDLSGKNAIVTGGAVGIGKGIASWLADAGASVMLTDIDMDAANRAVEEIRAEGGTVEAIRADAGNPADAKKVVAATVDAFGGLDVLVNNAGVYPMSPFLSTTEELWDKVMNINLKGVFFYSQAAAQAMVAAERGGKIINVCSIDALRPTGMIAHYNASKGGVLMLTKAMALELAPMKIQVNAVAPGGIMTPGTDETRKTITDDFGLSSEAVLADFLKRVPVGRTGEADDIAKVVLFLASGASDYMCGEMVVVDVGHLLA